MSSRNYQKVAAFTNTASEDCRHRMRPRLTLAVLSTICGMVWLFGAQAAQGQELSTERAKAYAEFASESLPIIRQNALLKKAAQLVGPSVVHIEAESFTGRDIDRVQEAGSGVVFQRGSRLFVLSNRHVIKAALADGGASLQSGPNKRIKIELSDHRVLNPRTVWAHADSDVAVMEVRGEDIATAKFGDSDEIEVGDFVLAMGSPFALSRSVTFGIVSALGRRDLDLEERVRYQDFIQVDAAINPGNSGGPLINMRGEVIGINTAIASNSGGNEGIGFSIPINMAVSIAGRMIEQGRIEFGYLGIKLDRDFSPEKKRTVGLTRPIGARILDVYSGTPAEKAGLKAGDVVLRFNDVEVDDDQHLVTKASLAEVGSTARLLVWRDGTQIEAAVVIGRRDDSNL